MLNIYGLPHYPVINNWVKISCIKVPYSSFNLIDLCFHRKKLANGEDAAPFVITTKRGSLARLAGFEVETKNSQKVPADTNFSLWLNVARSKM